MRRSLLATTTALTLLLSAIPAVGAQDASSGEESDMPSTPTELTHEFLPVPDYWTDWAEHKAAVNGRVALTINNVDNDRKRRPRFYREAIAVHRDELMWLANHQPAACYASEYERWRAGVEDLHTIEQRALELAEAGRKNGLKRVAKDRRAAVKRLDRLLSSVADCGPGPELEPLQLGALLAGKWKSGDNFVMPDGFHNKSRLTQTITRDGRYVLRDSNAGACRLAGLGYVPATVHGTATFDPGRRVLGTTTDRAFCHPRGRPRQSMGWQGYGETSYDPDYDVLYGQQLGYCWWRAKGGSPDDCRAFWRGIPTGVEDLEAVGIDGEAPIEETTVPTDGGS